MERNRQFAIFAVVCACAGAVAAVAADGRSHGTPRVNTSTFPTETFENALRAPRTRWFKTHLRCTRSSFLRIYKTVASAWTHKPRPNAKNPIMRRLALTMIYLAQGSSMDAAAAIMGISHTRAVAYINQTLEVLTALSSSSIVMPTGEEAAAVEEGFLALAGFPGVVGAIDGTLIRIPRPSDFEGWYCRKGFPAVKKQNVQAIVDHRGVFRSISIQAGSTNDQSLWNGSGVKTRISSFVPQGKHLLGDAGYKFWQHLVAPYGEAVAASSRRMRRYNYRHSRTRIVVECAFGRIKNRFRILLGKIDQKTRDHIVKVIVSCAVLHNFLTILGDKCNIRGEDPLLRYVPDYIAEELIRKLRLLMT